jgi:hypothetical protein
MSDGAMHRTLVVGADTSTVGLAAALGGESSTEFEGLLAPLLCTAMTVGERYR